MGKIVDITEKLSFDENPQLKIGNDIFEVNADATTVLKIMGLFSGDKSEVDAMVKAYDVLFSEKDRTKIAALKLPFKDLLVIIGDAMTLVMGAGESAGE